MSKPCRCCNGSGLQSSVSEDMSVACAMREMRIGSGITARDLARKLKVNEAYISMLESGKRRFTGLMLDGYRMACDPKSPARTAIKTPKLQRS